MHVNQATNRGAIAHIRERIDGDPEAVAMGLAHFFKTTFTVQSGEWRVVAPAENGASVTFVISANGERCVGVLVEVRYAAEVRP